MNRLAAVCAVLLLSGVAVALAQQVPIRNGGTNGTVLSATPQAIGNALSRVDYYIHNDADSAADIFCGYNSATLSATPGATSGDKLNPGEGKHICTFADQPIYCISLGAARVYFDESRMVTPTPTP